MARIEPTIPVTPKMYRHFAVITVGITTCLAMFADGENREAIEHRISQSQQAQANKAKEKQLASQGKGGNSAGELIDKRRSKGQFGADEGLPPVHYTGGGTNDTMAPDLVAAQTSYESSGGEVVIPTSPPPGMTIEEFEKLKKQLLRKKRQQAKAQGNAPRSSEPETDIDAMPPMQL